MNSSDATGMFPFPTAGYNYIFVSTLKGYVHFELLRKRTASEYLRACETMYCFYAGLGKTLTIQCLDNASNELKEFLQEAQVKIAFVAPGIHRQNPSERAIRHAKMLLLLCATPLLPTSLHTYY
jgi:hypothetical protein